MSFAVYPPVIDAAVASFFPEGEYLEMPPCAVSATQTLQSRSTPIPRVPSPLSSFQVASGFPSAVNRRTRSSSVWVADVNM